MLTSQHMEHVITRDEVMEIEWDLEGSGGRGDGDYDGGAGPRLALPSAPHLPRPPAPPSPRPAPPLPHAALPLPHPGRGQDGR